MTYNVFGGMLNLAHSQSPVSCSIVNIARCDTRYIGNYNLPFFKNVMQIY